MISPGKSIPGAHRGRKGDKVPATASQISSMPVPIQSGPMSEVRRRTDRAIVKSVFKQILQSVTFQPLALPQTVTDTIHDSVLKKLWFRYPETRLSYFTPSQAGAVYDSPIDAQNGFRRHLDMDGVTGHFERRLINDGRFFTAVSILYFPSAKRKQPPTASSTQKNDLMGGGIHLVVQKRVSIRNLRKSVQQPVSLLCRFWRNRRLQQEGNITPHSRGSWVCPQYIV